MTTLITNARLVNEGRQFDGDLRIENGRIAAIGSGLQARAGEKVVDGVYSDTLFTSSEDGDDVEHQIYKWRPVS